MQLPAAIWSAMKLNAVCPPRHHIAPSPIIMIRRRYTMVCCLLLFNMGIRCAGLKKKKKQTICTAVLVISPAHAYSFRLFSFSFCKGCHPTRIWAIIRHGTRNPSKAVILHAKERLVEIQARLLAQSEPNLCADELKQLRQWSWAHIDADDEKLLVAEGEDELIELAERMQLRFPSLLPDLYNPEWFYMKYTATQRTLKSAQSFATGLFGRHRIHAITYPQPLHRDPVLRVRLFRCNNSYYMLV